jgi:hypothetical protein
VRVAEDAAADGEDHRPVPPDEQGERGLLVPGAKALQQVRVAQVVVAAGEAAQGAEEAAEGRRLHGSDPRRSWWSPHIVRHLPCLTKTILADGGNEKRAPLLPYPLKKTRRGRVRSGWFWD